MYQNETTGYTSIQAIIASQLMHNNKNIEIILYINRIIDPHNEDPKLHNYICVVMFYSMDQVIYFLQNDPELYNMYIDYQSRLE